MKDENKIKELEEVRGVKLQTVKEVFDMLEENQVVVNEHGKSIDPNKKIYFVNHGAGHHNFYDENGKEIFLMIEERAVYAVAVVEDDTRCVYEINDIKNYDIALEIYKDECKKSDLEVILYIKKNNEWRIVLDRPQIEGENV